MASRSQRGQNRASRGCARRRGWLRGVRPTVAVPLGTRGLGFFCKAPAGFGPPFLVRQGAARHSKAGIFSAVRPGSGAERHLGACGKQGEGVTEKSECPALAIQ